jgi:hypothetical protein
MERPRSLPDRIRGIHNFSINFEGKTYNLSGRGTLERFEVWFNKYAPKAPRCAAEVCGEILFPGERIGKIGGKLYHIGKCVDNFEAMQHLGTYGNGGPGYISGEGKFLNNIPEFNK